MSVVLVLSIFVRIFSVYLSVHLLQGIYWIMIWHSDSYQPMQRSLSFDSQWQQTVNDINQLVHIHVNQPCEVDKYEGTSSSCFVQLINVAVSATRTDVECVWCCCIQPWTQGGGAVLLGSGTSTPTVSMLQLFVQFQRNLVAWLTTTSCVAWSHQLPSKKEAGLSGSCCWCISSEGFIHWFLIDCSLGHPER